MDERRGQEPERAPEASAAEGRNPDEREDREEPRGEGREQDRQEASAGGREEGREDDPQDAREERQAEELDAFLRELAEAAQAYALYPADHPRVRPHASRLLKRLTPLLRTRGALSVGIGPQQLFTEELETDRGDTALSSLAKRLHAHELSRLTLLPAIDADEIHAFLTAVAPVPDDEEDRLARRPRVWTRWSGVGVETVQYDRITLGEGGGGEEQEDEEEGGPGATAKLWLGLAEAASPFDVGTGEGDGAGGGPGQLSPASISESLARAEEEGRSAAVAAQLLRIAEELSRASGEGEYEDLRGQIVELVEKLSSTDLYRILQQGADRGQRHRFLLRSADWLPTDALVELMEQARGSGDVEMSTGAMSVLTKMARHASASDLGSPEAAESGVRDLVRRLMAPEGETEEQPDEYEQTVRGLSRTSRVMPAMGGTTGRFADPRVVIEVGLEVDRVGEVGVGAFRRMRAQGRIGELTELLSKAPEGAAVEELWKEVASREAIAYLLDRSPPDLDSVGRMVDRVGPPAAEPMLDLLETAESRSVRGKLFSFLNDLGSAIADQVVERLEDDRWYVQRNMLALLAEMEELPEDFSARPFVEHPRQAVRYEAYKILLGQGEPEEEEDELLARVLREPSERCVRLGLVSAEPPLSEDVLAHVIELAKNDDVGRTVRVLAVRALGPAEARAAYWTLLDLTLRRRRWLFWRKRLAEPSPVVAEAVRALREGWPGERGTERVLELAAKSDDAGVREAAAGEGDAADGGAT